MNNLIKIKFLSEIYFKFNFIIKIIKKYIKFIK